MFVHAEEVGKKVLSREARNQYSSQAISFHVRSSSVTGVFTLLRQLLALVRNYGACVSVVVILASTAFPLCDKARTHKYKTDSQF